MSGNDFPQGWTSARLADVVRPTRPKVDPRSVPHLPFLGMEHVEAQTKRLLGTVPAALMRSAGVHFQKGDVLYGRLRPYLNKVHRAAFEGVGSAEFIVLSGNDALDAAFLAHRLNAADFVEYASHLNEGDRPRVDFEQIGQFEVWLPPVSEQRRIVAALEEHLSDLDAAVAGLERARANITRCRAGTLAALTDGSDAVWPSATLDSLLSPQPRSLQSGPFGSNLLHSEFQDSGVLAIGIDNVGSGEFLPGRQHRISPEKYQKLEKYTARPGDVLITVMATIGRCCVVPENAETAIITKHVYRITVDRGKIAPRFLMYSILGAPSVRAQLFGEARGQTRPGLNSDILRRLVVPAPPIEQQHASVDEIDRRLAIADRTAAEIDVQLARAVRLRQSILKRAFEGKLVPQDPADESASVLLERIRAERTSSNAKQNGSRSRRPARTKAR